MRNPTMPRAEMRRHLALAAAIVVILTSPHALHAQWLVKGVQDGAAAGNKAAGPVGGVLGGAIGGVVGVFTGVLGVGQNGQAQPADNAPKQAATPEKPAKSENKPENKPEKTAKAAKGVKQAAKQAPASGPAQTTASGEAPAHRRCSPRMARLN